MPSSTISSARAAAARLALSAGASDMIGSLRSGSAPGYRRIAAAAESRIAAGAGGMVAFRLTIPAARGL